MKTEWKDHVIRMVLQSELSELSKVARFDTGAVKQASASIRRDGRRWGGGASLGGPPITCHESQARQVQGYFGVPSLPRKSRAPPPLWRSERSRRCRSWGWWRLQTQTLAPRSLWGQRLWEARMGHERRGSCPAVEGRRDEAKGGEGREGRG